MKKVIKVFGLASILALGVLGVYMLINKTKGLEKELDEDLGEDDLEDADDFYDEEDLVEDEDDFYDEEDLVVEDSKFFKDLSFE